MNSLLISPRLISTRMRRFFLADIFLWGSSSFFFFFFCSDALVRFRCAPVAYNTSLASGIIEAESGGFLPRWKTQLQWLLRPETSRIFHSPDFPGVRAILLENIPMFLCPWTIRGFFSEIKTQVFARRP